MFTAEIGLFSYKIAYVDGAFTAKSKQPDGVEFENGAIIEAELAFISAQKKSEYMPTAGMIEYYTAKEMGIDIEAPEMENDPNVIY
jgi:hypothetical protein